MTRCHWPCSLLALTLLASSLPGGDDEPGRHWAFQPVTRPPIPRVKDAGAIRNPIDAFVRAAQEARGLRPATEASRAVLARRLWLDLTGLPPAAEEVEAFVKDASPQAYERLVERLLASPAHGERWGRHWLDVARYADTEGYESDHLRPYAWRYRDWVVRAFNRDLPYDRFVRLQLAGDESSPYSDDNLIATGFLAAARLSSNEEDRPRQRNDVLVDVANATGSAFLGLTMQCAQCHSHKLEPITIRDYYRFQGFFVKGAPNNLALKAPELWKTYEAAKPPEYDPAVALKQRIYDKARARQHAEVRAKLTAEQREALDTPEEKRTPTQRELAREADLPFQMTEAQVERGIPEEDRTLYVELKKKIANLEKSMLDKPQTWGFYSPATSPHRVDVLPMRGFYPPPYEPAALARARPYILRTGDVHQRGQELDVGWPAVFGPTSPDAIAKHPRTALADWLTRPTYPLTARVWVNRVWQWHFGRGIVATPNDFGTKGAAPTHPELLDWLAAEFMASGWSTKHLHRLIVTSTTYRQSSRADARNRDIDPDNRSLWRWTPRRLEVEAIRDSMLVASGEFDSRPGGPPMTEENKSLRRTLYLLQKRQKAPAVQTLFDAPTAATESCAQRSVTTVPLQALYLFNNEFVLARAKALAGRVEREAGSDRGKQIDTAFRRTLCRTPDAEERAAALKFFATVEGSNALAEFCQALMNLSEFVYLE